MQTLYIYVHTLYVYIWVSVYRSLRLLSALGHCMRKTAVVNCRSRNQIKINKFNIHIDIWITTAAAVLCVCECDWRLCAWGSPSKLLAGRYTWTMCTSICNSLKTLNKQMNKNNNNNNKNLHTDIQMEINVVAAAFGTNWSSDLYEREREKKRESENKKSGFWSRSRPLQMTCISRPNNWHNVSVYEIAVCGIRHPTGLIQLSILFSMN